MISVRTLWLSLGVVTTSLALLIGTTLTWWAMARAEEPTELKERAIPYTGAHLRVEAAQGDVSVSVRPGEAGKVTLERQLKWSADRPTVTERWDGTTLRLSVSCPDADQPGGPVCLASYTLSVPPESGLEVRTSSGLIRADGIHGPLRLSTLSGDIDVSNTPAPLWARATSGDIIASRLRGGATDAEVGTGNVRLEFTKAPGSVGAVVRATGDVRIALPGGDAYNVAAQGETQAVTVRRDPGSFRTVTARSAEGDVTIEQW